MKKALLHVAGAVLLGAVAMLLPLQIFLMVRGEEGLFISHPPYVRSFAGGEILEGLTDETYDHGRVVYEPADPFVGILGVSFFSALGVYLIFKRRRPYSSHRQYPFFHS